MSLWLKGAIEERGCAGQGCSTCPYQIYKHEDTFACEGIRGWEGHMVARELWWLLKKPQRAEKLGDIIDKMEEDEEEILLMTLNQIRETISLMSGLRQELYELTGNEHFRFDPDEIDWDMEEYSKLITHWKEPDGKEVYTLVNALTEAEMTENYLREALRLGKPVQFE